MQWIYQRNVLDFDEKGPTEFDISYEQSLTGTFAVDDETGDTAAEARYSFIGSEGDEVTILVYALDPDAGLDVQVALLDESGAGDVEVAEARGVAPSRPPSLKVVTA